MKITTLLLFTTTALALPIPQWFSDLRNLPLRHVAPVESAVERLHPVLPRTTNFNANAAAIDKIGNEEDGDVQDNSAVWLNPITLPRDNDDSTGSDIPVQGHNHDILQRSAIWRNAIILPRDDADPAGVVDDGSASTRLAFESKSTHTTGGVPFSVSPSVAWIGELFRLPRASTEDV